MCGIAGIVALRKNGEVPALALESMTRVMERRGPDAEGLWLSHDRKTGFGHRRLAIVDLTQAGAQPMSLPDGSAVVTFNGEIYNFAELRRGLEAKGHVFRSGSDTEVLLHLYLDRGERMVGDLDGDFAFALYDARDGSVFLARDPAGVKPLCYAITDDYFIFASDVRSILASGLVTRGVDAETLYHYMTYLCAPPGRTMVAGISKLETGSALKIYRDGRMQGGRYWDPLPQRAAGSDAALDEELKSLFDDSVRKRMMSDVPLGVLFSGGVDSTLNAASFSAAIAPAPVDSFTVGMPGTPQDESGAALAMARHLGLRHHEISITGDNVLEALRDIAVMQDEPLSDPVCLPLYFVSKLARDSGVTVLQGGEGADELFAGYAAYAKYMNAYRRYWKPLSHLPRAVPRMASRAVGAAAAHSVAASTAAENLARLGRAEEFFMSSAIGFYEAEKKAVFSEDFAQGTAGLNSYDVVRPLYAKLAGTEATFLQKMTYIDISVRLPELLLMRVDRMSMAHSLEVRVPFLDKKLVEFAMRAPDAWKLRHGIPKEPVKKLAARHAPHETVYKPKKGFGAPLRDWFAGPLRELGMEALSCEDAGAFFDLPLLRQRFEAGAGSSREAFQLWVVINFILWKKQVLDAA